MRPALFDIDIDEHRADVADVHDGEFDADELGIGALVFVMEDHGFPAHGIPIFGEEFINVFLDALGEVVDARVLAIV